MSVAATTISGFLHKQGRKGLRVYQRRYFVLRGRTLYWFRNRKDQCPCGRLLVTECRLDASNDPLVFLIRTQRKTYNIRCESAEEASSWRCALHASGARIDVKENERSQKRHSDRMKRGQSPARRARSFSDTAAAPGLAQYAPERSKDGALAAAYRNAASKKGGERFDTTCTSMEPTQFLGPVRDEEEYVPSEGEGGSFLSTTSLEAVCEALRKAMSKSSEDLREERVLFSFPGVQKSPLSASPPQYKAPFPPSVTTRAAPPEYPAPPPPVQSQFQSSHFLPFLRYAASLPPGRNPIMERE